jgi:hypothetical protein
MMFIALLCALWLSSFLVTLCSSIVLYPSRRINHAKALSKFHLYMSVTSSIVAILWVATTSSHASDLFDHSMIAVGLSLLSAIFTALCMDALSNAYIVGPIAEYFNYLEMRYAGSNDHYIKGALRDVPSGMPWRLKKEAADTGIKILKQFDEMGYKSRMYVWIFSGMRHVRFDRVLIEGDRVHYKIAILSRRGKCAVPDGVSIDELVSEDICGRLSAALDLDITGHSTPQGAWITVNSFLSGSEKKKRKNNIGLFDTTDMDRAFTAGFNSALDCDLVFDDEPIEDAVERLQEKRGI